MKLINIKSFRLSGEPLPTALERFRRETKERVIYIGRDFGGLKNEGFGNPFTRDRSESIESFRKLLWSEWKNKGDKSEWIKRIRGLNDDCILVCFCAPLPCHGDVIIACKKFLDTQAIIV